MRVVVVGILIPAALWAGVSGRAVQAMVPGITPWTFPGKSRADGSGSDAADSGAEARRGRR